MRHRRLFGLLLLLYPRRFRRRFGDDMRATFDHAFAARRRAGQGVMTIWIHTVIEAVGFAAVEWKDTLRPRRRYRSPGRPSVSPHPVVSEQSMSVIHDLRLSVRALRRRPSFSVAAVVTLGLGIGANTAVFSVVNGVLWRPLAYDRPSQLVSLWPNETMSLREVEFLREHSQTLTSIATIAGWTMALSGVDSPTQVYGSRTSWNVFAVFGMVPYLGRTFVREDGVVGAAPVAVLSYASWLTRFGADSAMVGRSVMIDGAPHQVIGIMPPSFEALYPTAEVWIPLPVNPQHWTYTSGISEVVARLTPGNSVAAATAEFQQLVGQMRETFGFADTYGDDATLIGLKERLVGGYEVMFFVLLGAVGFILLMAGSNLSNLLLVKAGARRQEMALRAALGATRGRLVQLVLTESVLLSAAGGVLGLLLAYGGVGLLKSMVPLDTPRIATVAVDAPVLVVCFGFAIGVGLLFSVAPAAALTRLNLQADVGRVRSAAPSDPSGQRTRQVLVVLQIALAVMLVVGAGLMIQTTRGLAAVDPGFRPDHILTLRLHPTGSSYDTPEKYRRFYDDLVDLIEAHPRVSSVGLIQHLPFSGTSWSTPYDLDEAPVGVGQAKPQAGWRIISGRYFETMGIPLLEGRGFGAADIASASLVAIVNRTLARRHWPGDSPIGKRLRLGRQGETVVTVVGMVGDVLHRGLDRQPIPEVYRPLSQSTMPAQMLAVRTLGEPEALARDVQDLVWGRDDQIPVSTVIPLADLVAGSTGRSRLVMTLLTTFAAVALVLGAIGVYGVTSFAVSRRTNEIGIRMALGASEQRVRRLVLRLGFVNGVVGTTLGLIGAALLARFLSGLVFEISPTDPKTFGGVAGFMLLVAAAASYVPAWRATQIDPATALRES